MLTVSEPALRRLSARLARREAAQDVVLRFMRRAGGWRLRADHARPGDTSYTHDGRSVLVLDGAVAAAMSDMRLDLRKTDAGSRLRLRHAVRRNT